MNHRAPQHEIYWLGTYPCAYKALSLDQIEPPALKFQDGAPLGYVIKSVFWSDWNDCYVWIYAGKGYTGMNPRPEHLFATEDEGRASIAKRQAMEAKKAANDPTRKPRGYFLAAYRLSNAEKNATSYVLAKRFALWNAVSSRAATATWTRAERPDSTLAVEIDGKAWKHFRVEGVDFLIFAEAHPHSSYFDKAAKPHARREAAGSTWTPFVGIEQVGEPVDDPKAAIKAAIAFEIELDRLRYK